MQKRRNDVKARTTLLLALPDEHQLRFSKYETAKELWEAILKTFGRNEATKKTKKNQLKQQYGNFKAKGSKTLKQTFNRLGKGEVHTASTQVSTASTDIAAASLSHDIVCAYIASQLNGSQIKYEYITQLDEDDIEEIDIKECRAPKSQDRGKRESYKQGPKEEEPAPKALMDIDGLDGTEVTWPMTKRTMLLKNTENLNTKICKLNEELSDCENNLYHYKIGQSQVEARLVKFKTQEIKFCEKIRVLERDVEDLDTLLGSKRTNKNKEGLGYSAVPPYPAQVYSPPKKDLSWTGLPEFVDDTVTDYSRPTPSIVSSKSNTSDLQNNNSSVSEHRESKLLVKYAEMYKNTSKSPKVRGNQRNWNNLKSQQLEKDFLMQNKACFKCGHFDHLASDCGGWVEKGKTWPNNNFAHKNVTPRAVLLKIGRTPIAVNRTNMNVARPKMTSFAKTAHSNVRRPIQRKSTIRTQSRVLRVSTVIKKFPTVDSKFSTAKLTFTADLGNKGKAVKALACWIWRPKQDTTKKGPNCNGLSVTFKKYQYINTPGRLNGCSRHMIGNISYLSEYEPYDGGYVSFGQGGGKITGKGIIKTGKLEFENVYFMKELKYNLFSVSQICDNKNSVLFTDFECIVLGKDSKLKDDI
nr:ribonuclease H-like domain-containing protein [Tanacetum cinerariifolium]